MELSGFMGSGVSEQRFWWSFEGGWGGLGGEGAKA